MLVLMILSTGCSYIPFTSPFKGLNLKRGSNQVIVNETIEVIISCNKENIQTYIDKGWVVEGSEISEVPCTWKTTKASKKCNPKKDKGCLITVPDIMGTKTIYQLSRKKKIKNNNSANK